MGYFYNPDVPWRKVVCTCGHIQGSRKKTVQCTRCTLRFTGDERPHKTMEELQSDRKEIFEIISTLRNQMHDTQDKLNEIEKRLRPFD